VCSVPVFDAGHSSTDNSLIGTARSMVVENNSGYNGPQSTIGGATSPGIWRVDIDAERLARFDDRTHVAVHHCSCWHTSKRCGTRRRSSTST